MRRELFIPYKDFLLRVIDSVITKEQLIVVYDMMDRFTECFKLCVPLVDLHNASGELMHRYQLRSDEIAMGG